jgi:hypothetical protein
MGSSTSEFLSKTSLATSKALKMVSRKLNAVETQPSSLSVMRVTVLKESLKNAKSWLSKPS